jgi:hypothetical protein
MEKVRAALEFKEKWAKNPEGMELRRKAGVRANAAAWAKSREAWIEWWNKMKDELTTERAREVAALFLREMRGKWRTRKHPRCVRSVLMRVSKLGVWRFDDSRGLYINPAMEQARRIEQARMHEAEARAVEKERLAAERAEAARREAEAEAAEKEKLRSDEAKAAQEAVVAGTMKLPEAVKAVKPKAAAKPRTKAPKPEPTLEEIFAIRWSKFMDLFAVCDHAAVRQLIKAELEKHS